MLSTKRGLWFSGTKLTFAMSSDEFLRSILEADLRSDSFLEVPQTAPTAQTSKRKKKTNNKGLNCALQLDDGTVIVAHKNVLSKGCKFFELLFKNQAADQHTYSLSSVSREALKNILHCLYGRKMRINDDNVQDLLVASQYLNCPKAIDICSKFVMEDLSEENALANWIFAAFYQIHELAEKLLEYIGSNYATISKTEDFLDLSNENLAVILSRSDLEENEKNIFTSLMNWVSHQKEDRLAHLPELIPHIRLGCCIGMVFEEEVANHAIIKEARSRFATVDQLVKRVLDWKASGCEFKNDESLTLFNDDTFKFTQPRRTEDVILAIGDNKAWAYDEKIDKWIEIEQKEVAPVANISNVLSGYTGWGRSGMATLNGRFYICGGIHGQNAYCLDLRTGTSKAIAPLNKSHRNCLLVTLGQSLFAMELEVTTHLKTQSAEKYDPEKDVWTVVSLGRMLEVKNLPQRTSGFAVSTSNDLFVAGGHSGDNNRYLDSVLAYREEGERLIERELPCLTSARQYSSCATEGDNLYVLGGHQVFEDPRYPYRTRDKSIKTVEKLNTTSGEWSALPNMKDRRNAFGCVIKKKKIYAFGGYRRNALQTAEVLDLESKKPKWKYIQDFPQCQQPGRTMGVLIPKMNIEVLRRLYKPGQDLEPSKYPRCPSLSEEESVEDESSSSDDLADSSMDYDDVDDSDWDDYNY